MVHGFQHAMAMMTPEGTHQHLVVESSDQRNESEQHHGHGESMAVATGRTNVMGFNPVAMGTSAVQISYKGFLQRNRVQLYYRYRDVYICTHICIYIYIYTYIHT